MPPRRRKDRWAALLVERVSGRWRLVVVAGTVITSLMTGYLATAAYVTDLRRSDHPPLAGTARVEQLAQSVGEVQRQLSVSNFALLAMTRRYWEGQRDDAEAALAKNPDDRMARSQRNEANDELRLIDQQTKAAARRR